MSAREDELYFYFGCLHKNGDDPCTLYNQPGFSQFIVDIKRDMYYTVDTEVLSEELERKGFTIQKASYDILRIWPKFEQLDSVVQALKERMKDVNYYGSFITGLTKNAFVNWHIHVKHRTSIHTFLFSLDGKTKPFVSVRDRTYACNPDEVIEIKMNWDDPHAVIPQDDQVLFAYAFEEVPGLVDNVPVKIHKLEDIISWKDPEAARAIEGRVYKNHHLVPMTLPDGRVVQPTHTVGIPEGFDFSAIKQFIEPVPDPWEIKTIGSAADSFTVEAGSKSLMVRYRTLARRYLYGSVRDHDGNRYPEYEEMIIQPGTTHEFRDVVPNYKEVFEL